MEMLLCLKCGHKWLPRKGLPVMCPRCKSYNWHKNKDKGEKC
jgi:uncharacterized OB-fold protein